LDNAKADQMLDEKEAADWKYYKKLLRDTFIALVIPPKKESSFN
jgi:Cu+-exporting ATPase